MRTYQIPNTDLIVSRLAYGCGSLGWESIPGLTEAAAATGLRLVDSAEAERLVHAAYDNGITLFDQADVYALGHSEEVFGKVLKKSPGLRERIVLQSKCGQCFPNKSRSNSAGHVDASRQHIVRSVESSLQRLQTDRLDILLLHVPDTLVRPQEVARAFDDLQQSGKVRYFGVSNHIGSQIALLRKSVRQPLVINQIHLGLAHPFAFTDGMESTLEVLGMLKGVVEFIRGKPIENTRHHSFLGMAEAGTLDYCRLHDIQVQAYSPLRGDLLSPGENAPLHIRNTARLLVEMAQTKQTTPSALALAWLLYHPAEIVPIIGSTNPDHVAVNCRADSIQLTRSEWYDLFASAGEIGSRALA
jgi:predicted oxidoreductase